MCYTSQQELLVFAAQIKVDSWSKIICKSGHRAPHVRKALVLGVVLLLQNFPFVNYSTHHKHHKKSFDITTKHECA